MKKVLKNIEIAKGRIEVASNHVGNPAINAELQSILYRLTEIQLKIINGK